MKKNFLLKIGQLGLSLQRRGRRVLILTTMAVLFTGIIAFASIPGPDGVIHGCYKPGGGLSIIDSTAECKQNETALDFNQTGPQGPQGLAGPAGTSEAYNVRGDRISLTTTPQIILSKEVPAGSYVINAKLEAVNTGPISEAVLCTLNTGDSSAAFLDIFAYQIVTLQGIATLNGPTTITVTCTGQSILIPPYTAVMTAIKVDAIY